jgi:hypothetical protein
VNTMLIDLLIATESESVRDAFEATIDNRVANIALILKYCSWLGDDYESQFKVLERTIQAFSWPHIYELWVYYLKTAVTHLGGSRIERVRELFEKCLFSLPQKA